MQILLKMYVLFPLGRTGGSIQQTVKVGEDKGIAEMNQGKKTVGEGLVRIQH